MIRECAPSPLILVARNLAWRLLKGTLCGAICRYRPRRARMDVFANRTDVCFLAVQAGPLRDRIWRPGRFSNPDGDTFHARRRLGGFPLVNGWSG